ncbi:hypothetical protein [Streptomyces sp. NPDC088725]|uniref:hypothetical protein n=1 Tax=Streptomyces sp. NPDC088725 TaxID=3365873 RepID=UPI003801E66E
MTDGSGARRYLSRLIAELGTDGMLVVGKNEPGGDGADLVPGSALRWPPCECGHAECPDAPGPQSAADRLRAKVAERNALSWRERP